MILPLTDAGDDRSQKCNGRSKKNKRTTFDKYNTTNKTEKSLANAGINHQSWKKKKKSKEDWEILTTGRDGSSAIVCPTGAV